MFLSPALSTALDRIAERTADVRRAYTPGAVPQHDDVTTPEPASDFTLDPLAVAAPEGCYFVTAEGDGGRRLYTRDGAFALRAGRLVNREGDPILGRAGNTFVELRVDPIDDALGLVRDAALEREGSLVYTRDAIDPRSGRHEAQRVIAGRVALARFPAGTRLETRDGSHCTPPPGVDPTIGFAGDGTFGALAAMRRERSRIDVDESLIRLKEAYLAFDALQAAERAKSHLGKTAMDLLK